MGECGGLDRDGVGHVGGNNRREDGRGRDGRVGSLRSEDNAVDAEFSTCRCDLRHDRSTDNGKLLREELIKRISRHGRRSVLGLSYDCRAEIAFYCAVESLGSIPNGDRLSFYHVDRLNHWSARLNHLNSSTTGSRETSHTGETKRQTGSRIRVHVAEQGKLLELLRRQHRRLARSLLVRERRMASLVIVTEIADGWLQLEVAGR